MLQSMGAGQSTATSSLNQRAAKQTCHVESLAKYSKCHRRTETYQSNYHVFVRRSHQRFCPLICRFIRNAFSNAQKHEYFLYASQVTCKIFRTCNCLAQICNALDQQYLPAVMLDTTIYHCVLNFHFDFCLQSPSASKHLATPFPNSPRVHLPSVVLCAYDALNADHTE